MLISRCQPIFFMQNIIYRIYYTVYTVTHPQTFTFTKLQILHKGELSSLLTHRTSEVVAAVAVTFWRSVSKTLCSILFNAALSFLVTPKLQSLRQFQRSEVD